MLSRHMEAIPAAYERRFSGSDDLDSILNRIVLREMAKLEEFEYPDFPIENLGEDINGGEEWKRSLEYQRT